MDKGIKRWMFLMHIFDKYWGCHQMAERSFYFKGYQFPICARCTGMIIGEMLALITFFFGYKININTCIIMIIPMVLDGTIQFRTKYTSNNLKRITTGIVFGFGFVELIFLLITYVVQLL